MSSDSTALAIASDITRNLAYLLILSALVLIVVAFFKGNWTWAIYTAIAGVVMFIIAKAIRSQLA